MTPGRSLGKNHIMELPLTSEKMRIPARSLASAIFVNVEEASLLLQVFPSYINKPLPASIAILTSLSSPAAPKLSSSLVLMASREIVPYEVDLHKKPDALALSIIPP
jgi:hypothetical protein